MRSDSGEAMKFVLALVVALMLGGGIENAEGVAGAAHVRRTPLSIALKKAYQLWGVKPCNGHYKVELSAVIDGNPLVAGKAVDSDGGMFATPASTWTGCVMELRAEDWANSATVEENWPVLCTTVLHEWGHLTGHPHSDEPGAPPEPAGTSTEQTAVMRSEAYGYSDDINRCGWDP